MTNTFSLARSLLPVCFVAALIGAGCDDSAKPPASATGGQGISKLAETPSSLLGKSAARGRDVAKDAANAQSAALGMGQELTGEAGSVSLNGVEWSPPTEWATRPVSNPMRAAELVVAPDAGDGGGETLAVFSKGIGGDEASNIERWRSLVVDEGGLPAPASPKKAKIAGIDVTTIAMEGTLKAGAMSGSTTDLPNQAFRGAIVSAPGGTVFIKLTGPAATVAKHDAAWNTMIGGMRKP
jgi:hypothetical protein